MTRIALFLSLAFLSLPAVADGESLKLKKAPLEDQKSMERHAKEAFEGYFNALIAADYERAATFVHPDMVEPLRREMLRLMEQAGPQKTQATLKKLGIPDLATMKSMPGHKWWAKWAASPYGQTVQVMANKDVGARFRTERVACKPAQNSCDIVFSVTGKDESGHYQTRRNTVVASKEDGRWLVGKVPDLSDKKSKPRR